MLTFSSKKQHGKIEFVQDLKLLRDVYLKTVRNNKSQESDPTTFLLSTSQNDVTSMSSSLSERSVHLLQQLALIDPILAHAIVSSLISNDNITVDPVSNGSITLATDRIPLRERMLALYTEILRQHLSSGNVRDAVRFLRYFDAFRLYRGDVVQGECDLDLILQQLVQMTIKEHKDRICEPQSSDSLMRDVYESLLASGDANLLKRYVQFEDEAWANVPLSHFFDKRFITDDKFPFVDTFFKPIVNHARVTGKHLFESIVTECIEAIAQKQFDQLQIMVTPPMLVKLRPLILLLCWDRYGDDINTRREMIRVLWPQKWVRWIYFYIFSSE